MVSSEHYQDEGYWKIKMISYFMHKYGKSDIFNILLDTDSFNGSVRAKIPVFTGADSSIPYIITQLDVKLTFNPSLMTKIKPLDNYDIDMKMKNPPKPIGEGELKIVPTTSN
jgi:hypothetical protein